MTTALDDLKSWLQLPTNVDSAEYRMLPMALTAAQRAVKAYTGHDQLAIVTDDTTETTRTFDGGAWSLNIADVVGDPSAVEHSSDRSTWADVDPWWLEPPDDEVRYRLASTYCFRRWVRVTATFGVTQELSDELRFGTVMYAAKLWQRRNTITGVEGFGDFGVVRISRQQDPDIATQLDAVARTDYRFGIA